MMAGGAMKRPRSTSRLVAYGLAAIGLIIQLGTVVYAWWDADPRITCDRLPGWREWISCVHGVSHTHVWLFEVSVGVWVLSWLALITGRRFPSYVSALLPLVMVGFFAVGAILYWSNTVVPYMTFGEVTYQQLLDFAIVQAFVFAILVLPVFGSWLVGFLDRRQAGVPAG